MKSIATDAIANLALDSTKGIFLIRILIKDNIGIRLF